jgi:hypothetical protein
VIDVEPLIRGQLERLVPLPDGGRSDWGDVVGLAGLGDVRRGWLSRRRIMLSAAVLVFATATAGLALAGSGWLIGAPAPPAVVADFNSYTPQLGFHPSPGSAVLVAEDYNIGLYATTNKEGTYCIVVSAPWKRPAKLGDGGTCIPALQAAAPLIAGLPGASTSRDGSKTTAVVAGRVNNAAARTIRFTGPTGYEIVRPVGSSGFFVASVHVQGPLCASGDWLSTFTALNAAGGEIARATIGLAHSPAPGLCEFGASFHS